MKYIKEAISIFRNRWPEAAIFIILPVILAGFAPDSQGVMAIVFFSFFVFLGILYLGFLRTAFSNKYQPQMPLELLKEGRKFFWRFIQLGFAYTGVSLAIAAAVFITLLSLSGKSITPGMARDAKEIMAFQDTVYTAILLSNVLVSILFMKFILFLPALVIVNDVTVSLSFGMLKCFKLKDAKGLIAIFLTPVAISIIWLLFPPDFRFVLKNQKILSILPAIVNQCLTLVTTVAAIRFVADLDLLYDSENESESDLTEGEN